MFNAASAAREWTGLVKEMETVDAAWHPAEPEGVRLDLTSRPQNTRAEAQRRARARARARRTVCSALCWLSLLGLIGFAGGLDAGGELLPGVIGMAVSLGCFALFGTLADIIVW